MMLKLKRTKMVALMIALLLALPFTAVAAFADEPSQGNGTVAQTIEGSAANGAAQQEASVGQEQPSESGDEPSKDAGGSQGSAPKDGGSGNPAPKKPDIPQYTVSFVNHDEELFYTVQVQKGQLVSAPVFTPMLDNYVFLFWHDVSAELEDEVFDFHHVPVEGDLVLMAVYAEVPQETGETEAEENDEINPAPKEEEGEQLPESLQNGTAVIGKREETLGGLSILIVDDLEEEEQEEEEEVLADIEEDDVPLAAPAPNSPLAGITVNLYSNHGDCIEEGATIDVWAELNGYDGSFDVNLQWQYSEDGVNWTDIAGATQLSYAFVATSETVNYSWRIAVSAPMAVVEPSVTDSPTA